MRPIFQRFIAILLVALSAGCHSYALGGPGAPMPSENVEVNRRDGPPLQVFAADGSAIAPDAVQVRGKVAYMRGDTAWLRGAEVRTAEGLVSTDGAGKLIGVVVRDRYRVKRVNGRRTAALTGGIVVGALVVATVALLLAVAHFAAE
ncbi:MAG TPA: hypothetical protein VFE05_01215 [Longimicrobiaceae bacterium]|nr:hypothetical protein [Longimicrobiaceae bacterium]